MNSTNFVGRSYARALTSNQTNVKDEHSHRPRRRASTCVNASRSHAFCVNGALVYKKTGTLHDDGLLVVN